MRPRSRNVDSKHCEIFMGALLWVFFYSGSPFTERPTNRVISILLYIKIYCYVHGRLTRDATNNPGEKQAEGIRSWCEFLFKYTKNTNKKIISAKNTEYIECMVVHAIVPQDKFLAYFKFFFQISKTAGSLKCTQKFKQLFILPTQVKLFRIMQIGWSVLSNTISPCFALFVPYF